MTLVRWDPFRDVASLQDRVNRLFGDSLNRFTNDDMTGWGAWRPAVDIYEKEDTLVLKAELPGMSEKEIEIRVENGVLTLSGERKRDVEVKDEGVHRVERFFGTFTRTFSLPTTVDADKIRASYKNGVLEVILPKAEASRPKRIEIKAS